MSHVFNADARTAGQLTLFAQATVGVVDLDDTGSCPLAATCESCHLAADDLRVCTAVAGPGVYCLTLCGSCAATGSAPRLGSWLEAFDRAGAHCEHLGITLDEMAAACRTPRRGGGR